MIQAAMCFLLKENGGDKEALLAMKKGGFGQGKLNGVGGKLDRNKGDKNIQDTVIREVEEEIGVKIKKSEEVAVLNFSHPYLTNPEEKEWQVHIFLAREWEGEPTEHEEVNPKWFKINEVPYDEMWPDRKFWLPRVFNGEKIKANFIYKSDEIIGSYQLGQR